jgi:RHS repeat-associated protein
MSAVAGVLGATNYFHTIWKQPSPPTGFSMSDLVRLSDANHLNLVAVQRTAGDELVTPSVVHWKQNHYAAIVAQRGNFYEVVDPTFRMTRWLSADAINTECSGQFLVAASQVPSGWRNLSESETSQIFGKGFPAWFVPNPCGGDSGTGSSGCSICSQNGPPASVSSAGGGGFGPGRGGESSGASDDSGMPVWTVTEPGCDLWLRDEPLAYQPAKGPRISFKLFYSEEVNNNAPNDVQIITSMGPGGTGYGVGGTMFTFGNNWYPSWLSVVCTWQNNSSYLSSADLLAPGGGVRTYTNFDGYTSGFAPEFATNTRMLVETNSGGNITGFRLLHPTGAVDVYEVGLVSDQGPTFAYFLSQQVDERGNATTFIYNTNDNNVLLQYVIDGDGKTNTLAYTNITFSTVDLGVTNYTTYSNYVSQITDPYGRTVKFTYPGAGGSILTNTPIQCYFGLTNIVDVAGLSSSFAYADSLGTVTQLTTPYGDTDFYDWTSNLGEGASILTLIKEPNGSHQMFFYDGDTFNTLAFNAAIPTVYTDTHYVPTNRPADGPDGTNHLDNPDWNNPLADDGMRLGNSFYWGRQQFANLSTNFLATAPNWNPSSLQANDFILPRLRHWNVTPDEGQGNSLSMERDPSPDGTTLGEMTWYDYPGKPDYNMEGSSGTPTLIIKVLPDSSESYVLNQLDQWNNRTNVVTTYSANGTVLLRTNSYVYAANGIDLLMAIGPDGLTNAAYAYDGSHQVLAMTNALGEVTRYIYNAYEQPTSIAQPNGLVTTNIYGADGYLAQQIVTDISTNNYTYTNSLVYTHTDERGLTVTNNWDALERLTKVAYPDGTAISYTYTNLDLAKIVDRMGFATSYGYNAIRQKTTETNALGNTTLYQYCDCGALDSVEDALGNFTLFAHDNQGNLTQTTYPDGYTVNNTYNLLRQLVTRTDSSGMNVTNYYNNQGLPVASTNNVGCVKALAYDVDDRITNSLDSNNVAIGSTYDNLGRILTRSYPDGGVEKWGYTLDVPGPTSYTNQIGNIVLYGYDSLNRKTNEMYVGVTTNGFAYNGAGDLLTLTDGKNDTTTWGYDAFGRVTNKVDAANNLLFVYKYDPDNRLTNRWSAAKTNTFYSYDAVGNLTHITYPVSPAITLSYDALNRLTNMVDAVGTTVYGYDAAGQLLSEDGPWTDDNVGYTYANRLRTGLSLQAPDASAWTQGYGYDSVRRLTSITSPAGTFGYTLGGAGSASALIKKLLLPNGAYITNSYDSVARLLSTALKNSGSTNLDSYAYGYNQASQRTNVMRTAGDSVSYTYDNEGELKTAIGRESGGTTNRLLEQFGYAYDAAGNLNYRTNNALLQQFNVNSLNELTTGTNGRLLTVAGATTSVATNVTVNAVTAALYGDASFAKDGFTIAGGNNTFTAIAKDSYGRLATNAVTVNLPATNSYSYDLNGNLLGDGTRGFAYDDENELTSVYVTNVWREDFVYDGKMRRRIEKEYTWNGTSWLQTNEVHYVYDGNVVIQERNANNLPQTTYTRGNDLSGKLQGAGGIGGLLARTDNGQLIGGSAFAHAFYHADGNGNVTYLLYPNQTLGAKYLFDPYGNTLAMSGPLADANAYRFSSKEWDDNSGLYYYLYRFYDSNLQRWLNRDLIQEWGGWNLYAFIANNPVNTSDAFGQDGTNNPPPAVPPAGGPNSPILPPNPNPPKPPLVISPTVFTTPGPGFGKSTVCVGFTLSLGGHQGNSTPPDAWPSTFWPPLPSGPPTGMSPGGR